MNADQRQPDDLQPPRTTSSTASASQRAALKSRHAEALTTLMDRRSDLRGVHALADLVDDSVTWSA